MEDSNCMINMPNFVLDEKIGNKRVRADGEEDEIHIGRLEKRPSGILGVSDGGDGVGESGGVGGGGGGIIDAFISNVFQKNKSGTDGEVEVEVGGEDEVKTEDHLGGGGDGGGGGIISGFFANMFQHNGSADEDGHGQMNSDDHLLHEDVEKAGCLGVGPGGNDGDNGGGGESEDLNADKLEDKKDNVVDLPSKDTKGDTSKLKPDDYSERVFFLNNN